MTEGKHNSGSWPILINPYILALVASLIIILLLPMDFPKYKIEIIDNQVHQSNNFRIFDDLDNNGYSDEINLANNFIGSTGLSVRFNPHNIIEQWNFQGSNIFVSKENLIIGDFDNNLIKEIYGFTISNDSIFLNWVPNITGKEVKQRFITKVRIKKGKCDPVNIPLEMDDLDGDGYKELLFGINTGFSVQPRNVFAYNIVSDSLKQSPKSAAAFIDIFQYDVTGDGLNEILLYTYSPENLHDTGYQYHDSSAWMMVLDRKLEYLFPPIEIKGRWGTVMPIIFRNTGLQLIFGAMHYWRDTNHIGMKMMLLDTIGNIIKEQVCDPVPPNATIKFFQTFSKRGDYAVISTGNEIRIYDQFLDLDREIPLNQRISCQHQMDLDLDGSNEILLYATDNKLRIFRENMKHPAIIDISNMADEYNTAFSLVKVPGLLPLISIFSNNKWYLISYALNHMFYWRWAIYAAIYLSVLVFTLFVQKIQRIQLQSKYNTEKKITELQLKIIKNQLDPHFVLNAINSITSSVSNQKKEEATEHLQQFSQMYRSLVLSSDKITRTLTEEIAFTENYLKMEQFRFSMKFQYSIVIDPAIDTTIEVPKMIVQSYTENAIKHGLAGRKEGGGILEIMAKQFDQKLILTIKDNGGGRKESAQAGSTSTGKGVEMMNNLYDLYYKITNRKITGEIVDLYDDEEKSAGTSVIVTIPIN